MLRFTFTLVDDLIAPEAATARGHLDVIGDQGCASSREGDPFGLVEGVVALLEAVRWATAVDGVGEVRFARGDAPFRLRISAYSGMVSIVNPCGCPVHDASGAELLAAFRRDVVPFARHLCRCLGPGDATAQALTDELDDFEAEMAARH